MSCAWPAVMRIRLSRSDRLAVNCASCACRWDSWRGLWDGTALTREFAAAWERWGFDMVGGRVGGRDANILALAWPLLLFGLDGKVGEKQWRAPVAPAAKVLGRWAWAASSSSRHRIHRILPKSLL